MMRKKCLKGKKTTDFGDFFIKLAVPSNVTSIHVRVKREYQSLCCSLARVNHSSCSNIAQVPLPNLTYSVVDLADCLMPAHGQRW